ncbi:MAG: 16S rRNA (uracil(1498)-N(3))-methyltransferase [Prevotella sp.]|nr:16S rRNA (uracil(1498)-N(3))-methyltransferase [Bacteroides sp.]MCM1366922.1 16S rRNA (uracil(1498)-N(3))-methyltransferase [Prevotella sp.]
MIQFYEPEFGTDSILNEVESGHCIRVLRKSIGDTIYVTDGKGYRYTAEITEANPKRVKAQIIDKTFLSPHWGFNIILGIAPTKNIDRIEWLLEKATEIGIDQIIPIQCEHSERKIIKTERLEKILVSAMKQSLKSVKPVLRPLTPLKTLIDESFKGQKLICYCADDVERINMTCILKPQSDIMILIGPEGDFSPSEAHYAINNGFIPVSLGQSRLRTETAALSAIQTIHTIAQLSQCPKEIL